MRYAWFFSCIAVVALVLSVSGYLYVDSFSPDSDAEPHDRVVIFCIDGAGTCDTDTPNMDRIFGNGFWSESVTAEIPSMSSQNWGSALTGVSPDKHRMNNDLTNANMITHHFPTYFQIADALTDRPLASFATWSYNNMIEDSEGIYKKDCVSCEDVMNETISYITSNDPLILSVYMDSPDLAGHEYGFGSPEYYQAIQEIDRYVGKIYDKMVDLNWVDGSLIIAMTDHGGIDTRHGGNSSEELTTFLGVTGFSVVDKNINGVRVRDVAAIVLHGIGCEVEHNMTAKIPKGLFK